jgi:predicted RNase H-like nuclease (RuvC/YqgF family)
MNDMWFTFLKKEKKMSTTTANKSVKKLEAALASQSEQLSAVLNRMNRMADEIHLLKGELNRFKNDVASDVKYLTDRVDS